MPQLDFSTFLPQIFWLFISLSFLYIVLSRYALPRVSDVIEERKDIIAQDIDSAKEYSVESEKAIEELKPFLIARGVPGAEDIPDRITYNPLIKI